MRAARAGVVEAHMGFFSAANDRLVFAHGVDTPGRRATDDREKRTRTLPRLRRKCDGRLGRPRARLLIRPIVERGAGRRRDRRKHLWLAYSGQHGVRSLVFVAHGRPYTPSIQYYSYTTWRSATLDDGVLRHYKPPAGAKTPWDFSTAKWRSSPGQVAALAVRRRFFSRKK